MRPLLHQANVLASINLVLPLLLLGGCAGTKETVLPQDGPSMKAIYEAHFEETGARDPQDLRGELGRRPLGSGDTGRYVLGKTIGGGSDEVAKWLTERQAQSFDAVFVRAGTRVAIHIDRELPIDLDPIGRKLTHATTTQANPYTRLD